VQLKITFDLDLVYYGDQRNLRRFNAVSGLAQSLIQIAEHRGGHIGDKSLSLQLLSDVERVDKFTRFSYNSYLVEVRTPSGETLRIEYCRNGNFEGSAFLKYEGGAPTNPSELFDRIFCKQVA
jgi:hypothetical protein